MTGINKLYAYQFYGPASERTRESLRVVVDLVGDHVVMRSERSLFGGAGGAGGFSLAHDVQRAIDTDGLLVSTLTQTRGEFGTALRVLSELVGCDPAGKIDPGERPVGYSSGIMQIMDQRGELVAVTRTTRLAVEREIATAFYVGFHAGQTAYRGRR